MPRFLLSLSQGSWPKVLALCVCALGALSSRADEAPRAEPPALPLSCAAVESLALARHPILAEKSLEVDKAREKVRDVDMGALLPKFTLETGMGPAPGIKEIPDTISLRLVDSNGNRLRSPIVQSSQKEFDYGDWGPFFGIEATVAQPLNVSRYRAGRKAAKLQIEITSAEFKKECLDVSEEAQTLYYQRLFAFTLRGVLATARADLDRAQKRLADQLDSGSAGVTQTDVLQIKSGRYALDQGWNDALLGITRTELALRFLLGWPDGSSPALADTVLSVRPEILPPLDSLKRITLRDHPDLKRLQNGLAARQELLKVAQGELGPDIFLFGTFRYTKAWSSDRQSGGGDPFARDPLNELTGVGGIGMKLNLNFWQRYQKYRKERLELRQLERTEVYAARGLLLKVEDAHARMRKAKADVEEAQKSLRAAEAWLKGAAMKYDLDPSASKDLIGPFKQSLTGKRDFYQAVLEYDLSVARLLKAVGWTQSDYLRSLMAGGGAAQKE